MRVCGRDCTTWSRVVGYYQPTYKWHAGKKEEFKDRVPFDIKLAAKRMKEQDKQEKADGQKTGTG